ncbi:hypothetical protein SLS62_006796 [Diatrype stigma]|uniref:Peptide hydrolase n=1 Tax=Diatrype stigma TaxID=117547 RepID=A0AAN9YNT9_9PEZI
MAFPNPLAFKPFAVTFWTTVTYLALLVPLLVIHESVPPPPTDPVPYPGINLTSAWLDLTVLTRYYHPFNSRANDGVHDWLLDRLDGIKQRNVADDSDVVIFEDLTSNVTVADSSPTSDVGFATYFEGTNILVYIRGKDDPRGPWWEDGRAHTDKVIAFKGNQHPFGTVVFSDAFATGAIRSGTDYSIFHDAFGLRGLDVAFYRPRARYHTNQDDVRHTSKASLWHMLGNSLDTMKRLSGDTGETFIGSRPDEDRKKVSNGNPTDGVWFDIFGKAFAVFGLRTMFAWSLTLLIASPLILVAMTYVLVKQDKYYYFSARKRVDDDDTLEPVKLGGRKGIVRFPLALVIAAALVIGAAYLITKINPLVIYGNEYTVWAMMLSLFYFVFWTIMAGANFVRPSALHRGYAIFWLFIIGWAFLVANTVFEDRHRVAAGYIFVFFQAATFLASFIALCELFTLPTKSSFARRTDDTNDVGPQQHADPAADNQVSPDHSEIEEHEEEESEPPAATESTPLIGAGSGQNGRRTTFSTTYRRSIAAIAQNVTVSDDEKGEPYEFEQAWSAKLPGWVWILQFLLLGPFLVILTGQIGLVLVSSVSQTGADGSSLLLPHLLIAFFSILLLLPLTPFVHRITHHIPMFLLVVFIATLIYNLVVFPFSPSSRYKLYFQQSIDLDTGASTVNYVGLEEYVKLAVAELPSAMGKDVNCTTSGRKSGLTACSYDGSSVLPKVVKAPADGASLQGNFTDWVTYNITRGENSNKITMDINATETRSCAITFDKPISSFRVYGGNAPDERLGTMPKGGFNKLTLYRRDWSTPWKVDVELKKDDSGRDSEIEGRISCGWDDANTPGTIPAFDEGIKFAPAWVALSKLGSGLCEGSKAFKA